MKSISFLIIAFTFCLNVQAPAATPPPDPAAKAAAIQKKKQATVAKLRESKFGGTRYKSADTKGKTQMRSYARSSLMQAGYTREGADTVISMLIQERSGDPVIHKPVPPVFRPPGLADDVADSRKSPLSRKPKPLNPPGTTPKR